MTEPQYLDGWRIDVGPDGVAASDDAGSSLIIMASGRIMSAGGCDVPGNVVQLLKAELAKLAGVVRH